MPTILHLGVIDLPYAHDPEGKTTGDVAEILERKYGVMETFFEAYEEPINNEIHKGYEEALESMLMGAPAQDFETILNAGTSGVERLFHEFIETGEAERRSIPGTPTKASLRRRSLRFKAKKATKPRPSFYDTGLYEGSFKARVEFDPFGIEAFGIIMSNALGEDML